MNGSEFDDVLTHCPICGNEVSGAHLTDWRNIDIARCENCGFQFMNPQYSDRYLANYYANYMGDENFVYWREALAYGHGFYMENVEKYIQTGRMLDIGCGNGHLLEAAKKRGWSVCGYDVDSKSTSVVAQRLEIEVASGNFFSCDFGQEKFDLVTMHQVLEHLKAPNEYLQRIRSLLNDGGYFFVAVPNIRSASNRLKRFLEVTGVRRKNIGKYYDTSHHILYFEPATLLRLLEKHGFQVVYKRNCHSTRPNQSRFKRFVMRNITDHLFQKSAFFVIARKL